MSHHTIALLFAMACALAVGSTAEAQVLQGDGTPIPQTNRLRNFLAEPAVGELDDDGNLLIDVVNDAAITPETFVPDCKITFDVLARGAGDDASFGWYNADPNAASPPPPGELYTIVQGKADNPVGSTETVNIRQDTNYAGGSIGFFLYNITKGNYFYTEDRFNPGSQGATKYIQRLIYDSKTSQAFYFAWEDLNTSVSADNDFEDLLMRVSNIFCTGAGSPCSTGLDGVCGNGIEQCVNGDLACVQAQFASDERCDGLDNDCDGDTDEDTDLCPGTEQCRFGRCVPDCEGVEFACTDLETCVEGVCVENTCLDVSCPAGQVCRDGNCLGLCDGIVCPFGQVCQGGRCADPCEGISCEGNQVCQGGVCRPSCNCSGCDNGFTCFAETTGECVENACIDQSCDAGFYCLGGSCEDACAGAQCPAGQKCEAGQCVIDPDAPSSSGGGPNLGGTVFDDNPNGAAGADSDGDGADDGSGDGSAAEDGCKCSTRPRTTPWATALLLLMWAATYRLRQRRHARTLTRR